MQLSANKCKWVQNIQMSANKTNWVHLSAIQHNWVQNFHECIFLTKNEVFQTMSWLKLTCYAHWNHQYMRRGNIADDGSGSYNGIGEPSQQKRPQGLQTCFALSSVSPKGLNYSSTLSFVMDTWQLAMMCSMIVMMRRRLAFFSLV